MRAAGLKTDGEAGAIAIAVAAAYCARAGDSRAPVDAETLFAEVLRHTPVGQTRNGILRSATLDGGSDARTAGAVLGNGSRVLCEDTVPFCLWVAAHTAHDYEAALWRTIDAGGDRDTTAAIVGGLVALVLPDGAVPSQWESAREPLPAV